MNILNQLATDLFKKLINNSDKYLKNYSPRSLQFIINDTYYYVVLMSGEAKETTPIKFKIDDVSFYSNPDNPVKPSNSNLKFVIYRNGSQYYDVFLTRLEMVQYLDKIDNIMKIWEENQLMKSLEIINQETDEFNEEL